MNRERAKLIVRGAVQGVGFRPFVYRLAAALNLDGWVSNSAQGVFIEVEGTHETLENFLLRLEKEKPSLAIIQSLEATFLDPVGYKNFEIRPSAESGNKVVAVSYTHLHLAGVTKARTKAEYFRGNGEATRNLLKLCAQHAKNLQRFVYVSSLAAAGPSADGHLITEEEMPQPVSIYGRSKLAGETACQEFCREFPITIIRPPAVYGPREKDIYEYFKQVQMGVRLRLGWRERQASMIHGQDLVNGILLASAHPARCV